MEKKPKVLTLILTWNSKAFISKCIDSVQNSTYKTDLLVIDNNSADNTEDFIRKHYKNIDLLQTGANLGYAGGNNVGIKIAIEKKYDYVFVLNPDAIIDNNCIKELITNIEKNKNIGMASPKIYYMDNPRMISFAGGKIDWKNGTTPPIVDREIDTGKNDKQFFMDNVSGCAMMIKLNALKKVGLMDENYFLYFEETDLSVRFTQNNYKLLYIPSAKCWHNKSSSTGGFYNFIYQYYMTRNSLLFMKKYGRKYHRQYLFNFIKHKLISIIIMLKINTKQTRKSTLYLIKGILDYNLNKFGKQT